VILSVILSVIFLIKISFHKKKAKDTHNLPPAQPFHTKRCENGLWVLGFVDVCYQSYYFVLSKFG